jgi:hypothetical protein
LAECQPPATAVAVKPSSFTGVFDVHHRQRFNDIFPYRRRFTIVTVIRRARTSRIRPVDIFVEFAARCYIISA